MDLPVVARNSVSLARPLVSDVATVDYGTTPGEVDRYNMQRVVSFTANVHGEPLGQVVTEIRQAIARAGAPPRGISINNRGQVTMNSVMSDGTVHAFVVANGVPQDLGTYPADAFLTVAPCCNNINDVGKIVGFSIDSSFNQRALLWQSKDQAPVDLNTLIPADSPWYLLSPGGITNSGEIAATAVNLNTFEVHAVVVSPIAGVGPAARGAKNPPTLPDNVRKRLQGSLRH